ncbi:VOC family protein [Kangiella sp. HZ709]|uniref:VOC family protein n=1 Tax=Kangiella sp. HZ709 TaxID=2666328 RepID=UPI0012B13203|nr:hydroxylase [Kangiella sp. HZ709]MRX27245.1 hydroxylase [Kangiella sp. HZ709]
MQIHYLEIVTSKVDELCAYYSKVHATYFNEPEAKLGYARVASLENGGMIGVRAQMHESEEPIVRPYLLVDDIEVAIAQAIDAGAQIAHPPLEISGYGHFAIYILGGVQHGLWQL